jgi:8-oxo-dGTP diphosphatase
MIEVACAVIFNAQEQLLIAKRGAGRDEGLWEFPGGKKKKNESILEAAEREIYEELNIVIRAELELYSLIAVPYILKFIKCSVLDDNKIELKEHSEIVFVQLNQISAIDLTKNDQNFLNWLKK